MDTFQPVAFNQWWGRGVVWKQYLSVSSTCMTAPVLVWRCRLPGAIQVCADVGTCVCWHAARCGDVQRRVLICRHDARLPAAAEAGDRQQTAGQGVRLADRQTQQGTPSFLTKCTDKPSKVPPLFSPNVQTNPARYPLFSQQVYNQKSAMYHLFSRQNCGQTNRARCCFYIRHADKNPAKCCLLSQQTYRQKNLSK